MPAPPTATRARFSNTAEGRERGHRDCKAQTCVPRPQTSQRLLPRQVPGPPHACGRPHPPHSPLGTGSAWLPQPHDAQSACARVCLAWGRGGTGRAESRGAHAQCAPSLGADSLRDGCGGSARACAPVAFPHTLPTAAGAVGSSGSGLKRCLALSGQNPCDPMLWSGRGTRGPAAAAGLQGEPRWNGGVRLDVARSI